MRYLIPTLAAALVAAGPALARGQDKQPPDRPITDRKVDAVDVATTPATDLNLRKDEIPDVLIAAQGRPYDLAGLKKCKALAGAVAELNTVLGPDIDLPQDREARLSAGRVARSVVGSFIPFRGVVREVSGANDHQRRVQAAIEAGLARRGFLKGVGMARGCAYPARAASEREVRAFYAGKDQ